ncbi:DUF1281 domain-containing protein [Rouxiella sp. WC2420]|uniref:DUF1281 domain-containing protein n=1 Tax=Rouxiella sp. WC2420 TaxID=3234145 RepID=UPI00350EC412
MTMDNIRLIERWYRQSGIKAVKWENIPFNAQQRMADIIQRKYADWFSVADANEDIDACWCWNKMNVGETGQGLTVEVGIVHAVNQDAHRRQFNAAGSNKQNITFKAA